MKGSKWVEAVLGLWILFSPWLLESAAVQISNVIVGIAIILLVGMDLFGGKSKTVSPQM